MAEPLFENDRVVVWEMRLEPGEKELIHEHHNDYLMVQIAGAIARRIRCHVQAGSRVERGGRVGMIMFGSRCDLYLPPVVRPTVARGDRLRAGASVVGEVPL